MKNELSKTYLNYGLKTSELLTMSNEMLKKIENERQKENKHNS